jgi:hypothetical protein
MPPAERCAPVTVIVQDRSRSPWLAFAVLCAVQLALGLLH